MLTVTQQAQAALTYVKHALQNSPTHSDLMADPAFVDRLDMNFVTIFGIQSELYGHRADCLESLVGLVKVLAESWMERPDHLKKLDKMRELDPEWFQSNDMLGGVCYVDRYATDLTTITSRIPYFKSLGLTYVHLMPLFDVPEPENDGGYAVTSYRRVKPILGDMDQLKKLAKAFDDAGISLVLDFIFNHTSWDSEWAKKACAGDKHYEQYYWMFPDRTLPDLYEQTTREIFPDDHAGSFIQLQDGRWVWSTFYHYQWDLNYSNPAVFNAMAREMLFLANAGVNILRMDAVAFIWKQIGTTCESLPEAHKILRCFNAVCRIAAPSLIFKSEAIVHPDYIVQYIDRYECQISYNPLQMCLLWESLATRNVSLLSQALEKRHNIVSGCAWVNYVRSHDDIGWTFADEDALELGKEGGQHRKFLNAFFVNRYPGSFARGVPFQDNPKTNDCRIAGTCASLSGLESGETGSVERILLMHSIIMSTGGIPLIYLGDEIGTLNDYSYMSEADKKGDSRWVNRPKFDQARFDQRQDPDSQAGKIFSGFSKMIEIRKTTPEFAGGQLVGFRTHNPSVLGYQRPGKEATVLCLANFSDDSQWVGAETLGSLSGGAVDLISGATISTNQGIHLKSHQYLWLKY